MKNDAACEIVSCSAPLIFVLSTAEEINKTILTVVKLLLDQLGDFVDYSISSSLWTDVDKFSRTKHVLVECLESLITFPGLWIYFCEQWCLPRAQLWL